MSRYQEGDRVSLAFLDDEAYYAFVAGEEPRGTVVHINPNDDEFPVHVLLDSPRDSEIPVLPCREDELEMINEADRISGHLF